MDKCFIICRQSSGQEDPDDSLSIQVQEDECRKLAISHNLSVVECFKEANTSGRLYPRGFDLIASQDIIYVNWCKETKKLGQWRDGLGEIMKRLKEVSYVVAYDMTRFFRPLNGSLLGNMLTQIMQTNGVKLLTIREGVIDFSRFQDSLVSSLTSQINSEQLRLQTEKSRAAYKRLKDEGAYYAGLMQMHGYRKTGRRLEVEIDPRGAELVKKVFKLYINGVPVNEIVKIVNGDFKDIFPHPCQRTIIDKMLRTPAYCGYQYNSSGELVKSKQLEGKAIVSMDTWMKAHERVERGKVQELRPKKRWVPMSGFVYCGHCGAKMKIYSRGKDGNSYFFCFSHTRQSGKKPCPNRLFLSLDRREGIGLIEAIKPLLLAEAIRIMKLSKDDEKTKEEVSRLELVLAEQKRKMKKLTDMWMSGTMDEAVYESAMKELKQKSMETERAKTKAEMNLSRDTSAFDWVKLEMKFRGDYLSKGEYEQLMMGILNKIVVYKDFVDVKTTFGDVSLPRHKVGRYNVIWNNILEMKDQHAKLYFYHGRWSRKGIQYRKTSQLGELEIYIQE